MSYYDEQVLAQFVRIANSLETLAKKEENAKLAEIKAASRPSPDPCYSCDQELNMMMARLVGLCPVYKSAFCLTPINAKLTKHGDGIRTLVCYADSKFGKRTERIEFTIDEGDLSYTLHSTPVNSQN